MKAICKADNTKRPHANENECSKKDGPFVERIRTIVSLAGGIEKLARSAGMTSRVIGKYLAGESEPNRTRLVSLARAAGVSIAWLATGEGTAQGETPTEKSRFTAEPPAPFGKANVDEDLLLAILKSIEETLRDRKARVSIEKKAKLMSTLYRMQPALPLAKSAVCQIIELIG